MAMDLFGDGQTDTYITRATHAASLKAVGAVSDAVNRISSSRNTHAYILAREPGMSASVVALLSSGPASYLPA